MPDVLLILITWWKRILIVMCITTGIALLFLWLMPDEYLSVSTALPANSAIADKARIFNANIQALYPEIGTPDELDKILGTAALDTIYLAAAQQFDLPTYYKISSRDNRVYNAARLLKKNTRIIKNDYGALQVKVWDKDRNLSAALANALMQELQQIHQALQNESNALILQRIQEDYASLQRGYQQTSDSVDHLSGAAKDIVTAQKTAQLNQLQQYDKLMAEYRLVQRTAPQALLIVERARPPLYHDRPDRLQWSVLTLLVSGMFAFLTAVFIESKKRNA